MAKTKGKKPAKRAAKAAKESGAATPVLVDHVPYPKYGSLTRHAEERLQRTLTAELGTEWKTACGAFVGIGQKVVDSCYEGDAGAALADAGGRNGRFAALARRLEALGIGLSAERLSVARRIVAWNHAIRSPYWDQLDDGHKEVLLPLREKRKMIAGARYALQFQATNRHLEAWVRRRRETTGTKVARRGQRWSSVERGLGVFEQVSSEKSLERVGKDVAKLTSAQKKESLARLQRARAGLAELEKLLRDE